MLKPFPFVFQTEEADCGPACLKMILDYFGKRIPLDQVKKQCPIDRNGITLKGLSLAAEHFGLRTNGVRISFLGTENEAGLTDIALPCIAYWESKHYVVVYKVAKTDVWLADPAFGKKRLSKSEFESSWIVNDKKGILLLLEPNQDFLSYDEVKSETRSFSEIFKYLSGFKQLLFQLFIGLFVSSMIALVLPFLTQMIVDKGIANQDINLIYLILIGQILIFLASTSINFIQAWIFLHIGTRVNVSLIHDFLIKLMKLPISFFNNRTVGDLLQRIEDHGRINSFITGSSINVIFSTLNILVFSIVLLIYSAKLFSFYWIFSIIYFLWIVAFLKKRKELDYKSFEAASKNQSKLLEIINGIQEIKLQGSEKKRRWQWVNLQAKIFRVNSQSLMVTQIQETGAGFINQLKNILVSFFAATAVINGEISLGMMLAVQYIIGYINSPLESVIGFIRNAQDAKISFDRLHEIHKLEDEEPTSKTKSNFDPSDLSIEFVNVSFQYSKDREFVIRDLSTKFESGKITAIVGSSGSGKTTLLKLMLGFYKPTSGTIRIGKQNIDDVRIDNWRNYCGAVLQDGFIFPDTVAHNICESDDYVDNARLMVASHVSNLQDFSNIMHAGFNTVVGENGINLSRGQLQRILIARAVYKNPHFFFFDEATNSLDANNEKVVMNNFTDFCKDRTVIIVAHRLSTVKNADKIVVLNNGSIVEEGCHSDLMKMGGHYFNLISNQVE